MKLRQPDRIHIVNFSTKNGSPPPLKNRLALIKFSWYNRVTLYYLILAEKWTAERFLLKFKFLGNQLGPARPSLGS